MANSGKRFEGKFHKSLWQLPGASMRIEDGGGKAKNKQMGDFLYWDLGENTFLFECKATHGKSFKLRNLTDDQLESLLKFDALRESNHSVIAINYYGDDVAQENHCVLINVNQYKSYIEGTDKASLSYDDALDLGFECSVVKGNIWNLNPWAVI